MGDHAQNGRENLTDRSDEERAAALERGRLLFALPCGFVTAAARLDQVPAATLPEIAFAGRSNVGKSSLINALTGRNTLARTSNTPGRTQLLIFFNLGNRLTLTDLPGYGYAAAPKSTVERWTRLVDAYLRGRAPLRRGLLLVDARRGIKGIDREVMSMLDRSAVSYQVILTKCDKLKPVPLADLVAETAVELARHTAGHPEVLATSARTQAGIPELRAALGELALPVAAGAEEGGPSRS